MTLAILISLHMIQEDVAALVARHTSSIEMINSVSCDVEVRETGRIGAFEGTGKYLRKGSFEKVEENNIIPGRKGMVVVKDGKAFTLFHSNGRSTATIQDARSRTLSNADAWQNGLLHVLVPGSIKRITLAKLVEISDSVTASRQNMDGDNIIILNFNYIDKLDKSESWKIEVHLHPARNYMIKSIQYTSNSTKYKDLLMHYYVTGHIEPINSVFYPSEVEYRVSEAGKIDWTKSFKFKNVKINTAIPDSEFTLVYPHNILMIDNLRGVKYQADSAGRPISPEVSLNSMPKKLPPPAGQPVPSAEKQATPASKPGIIGTVSTSESGGLMSIVYYILMAVFIVCLAYLIYRQLPARAPREG